jgi:asparagine synthase (glutamine-hydrolysing)
LNVKENIDPEAVELYFSLGFVPAPWTIYKGVQKVEARQNVIIDVASLHVTKYYYYDLPEYKPKYDKKALIDEGRKILEDAVKIRMRSDVPVGAFLSGGLDSSTVV